MELKRPQKCNDVDVPLTKKLKSETVPKKTGGHWSMGLLGTISDPTNHVWSDSSVVIIRDKFPKAKFHYLILPKNEDISSIDALNATRHISLLRQMHKSAIKLIERDHQNVDFKLGYHAQPSMQGLHLHAISTDMDSVCLKTKKHWNSFNTDFFLSSDEVCSRVEKGEKANPSNSAKCKALLDSPLKCHKCSYMPKNLPDLKKHIISHLKIK